ncbi:hypothetical protein SAMN05421820_101453 [Pedobacter steynii]|uniref:Uncharacterized protein n=2 Tax=Pedobacter steynii TaxID=430522 RepID=A0A1G9K3S7_9SPHI|nr:hypothetical protein SAMN05421820_101453 [Pedobacter steynii]
MEAQIEHKGHIVGVLTRALKDNKNVLDMVGGKMGNLLHMRRLIDYVVNICSNYRVNIIYCDQNPLRLVFFPGRVRLGFKYIYSNLKRVAKVTGFAWMPGGLRREMQTNKWYLSSKIYRFWFIGVLPGLQRKDYSCRLLFDLIVEGIFIGRKSCLESFTLKKLSWYQYFSFNIYKRLDQLGYQLYFRSY